MKAIQVNYDYNAAGGLRVLVDDFPEQTEISPVVVRNNFDPERIILTGNVLKLIADNGEAAYRIRDLDAEPWVCDLIVSTIKI